MNSLVKFFHEIMHPHCEHCEAEKLRLFEAQREQTEENNRCVSCETLQITNDSLIRENDRLIVALIDKNKNTVEVVKEQEDLKPVRTTSHIPWNVRRQMKEAESRAELKARQDAAQPNNPKSNNRLSVIDKDKELQEIEKELEDARSSGSKKEAS